MTKNCGTCGRWGKEAEQEQGFRPCKWTPPVMPFWADLTDGADHESWTTPGQGRNCPTWADPEEMI